MFHIFHIRNVLHSKPEAMQNKRYNNDKNKLTSLHTKQNTTDEHKS